MKKFYSSKLIFFSRNQLRPITTKVVKGEAPMPEVKPVVKDESKLSVRQRAAAFASVMGKIKFRSL